MSTIDHTDEVNAGDVIFLDVPEDEADERLDQWLSRALAAQASRSRIQKWIKGGCVSAAGKVASAAQRVHAGERFRIEVPAPVEPDLTPTPIDFAVVYEDDDLAVIHKPADLAVHPGPGDGRRTLVNGLLHRWGELSAAGGLRPGIVHRLDKLTEGLLIVARNERAQALLSAQFQERKVKKEYLAYLLATPAEPAGRIDTGISRHPAERRKMRVSTGGRQAITDYSIEETFTTRRGRKFARARLHPITGRTHQLRVHMAHIGCPIVGDPFYSRSRGGLTAFGMLLLARRLEFEHPRSGERLTFGLDLPERFRKFEEQCVNL